MTSDCPINIYANYFFLRSKRFLESESLDLSRLLTKANVMVCLHGFHIHDFLLVFIVKIPYILVAYRLQNLSDLDFNAMSFKVKLNI